ncbi:uncharacterized protein LOC119294731 [Triticum dicoccoides]|uniref:uncharacterized protein LOC119294731 n=1 Tax=Triticum dicoccoides TaxID=85692 RepID=UPI000E79A29D|nr:uncharacterized protein LOC119294731 [Triticum dicoccoides]
MKARQLVNVVMRRYGMGSSHYSVSRIKPEEQLFFPSTKEAREASSTGTGEMETISRMPAAPSLSLVRSAVLVERLDFLPFYERKILCVDAQGRTVLYDADADAGLLHPLPSLRGPKGPNPISFSILDREPLDPRRADVLYVMPRCPRRYDYYSFEALMYSDPSNGRKGWRWHRLPPPPASANGCHALVDKDGGGDPILVVSSADGTHCFHTFTNTWFEAGGWRLPFAGRAHRVAELDNLWFGIARAWPYDLCAMDLYPLCGGLCPEAEAPRLAYSWGDHLSLPDDWEMMDCSMVYLGGGRFCVAKIFEFCHGDDDRKGMGVISGLEVVRQGEPSKLVMVKHKSKLYKFTRDEIQCIL